MSYTCTLHSVYGAVIFPRRIHKGHSITDWWRHDMNVFCQFSVWSNITHLSFMCCMAASCHTCLYTVLEWGSLIQFLLFHYFCSFSEWSKYCCLTNITFCDDTFQIWIWFSGFYIYFCETKNCLNREIIEGCFSKPHPEVWASAGDNFAIKTSAICQLCL